MSAHRLRRTADVARLHELAAGSAGRIRVLDADAGSSRPLRIHLDVTTVAAPGDPGTRQRGVTLRFELPSRYPFERPVIRIETPIFHPNVFTSGVVCQGEKWLPSHGIDVVVRRMIDLVTFAPLHVNPASAANRAAADWYVKQARAKPASFPTDTLATGDAAAGGAAARAATPAHAGAGAPAAATTPATAAAAATAASATAARVVVDCPRCGRGLRLPAGRSGRVECPGCHHEFDVTT